MTKFDELQQMHQQLLADMNTTPDEPTFVSQVQAYITQVCEQSQWISAPRDRDQLRANLRFWGSFVYDKTGTYPNTTMRPAQPVPAPSPENIAFTPPEAPAPQAKRLGWLILTIAIAAIAIIGIGAALPLIRAPVVTPTPAPAAAQPTAAPVPTQQSSSSGGVSIDWTIVTQGPSPFDPNTWVARVRLSGRGGNGAYIYWVDGQRLPDVSGDEFTVEGQGCQAKRAEVGVTSNGQSASRLLEINSPLSQCR